MHKRLTYSNTCRVLIWGLEGIMWGSVHIAKKMHKHEDSCKTCASLELKKNQKLRVKATGQGLERKPKKKVVIKKEKKRK